MLFRTELMASFGLQEIGSGSSWSQISRPVISLQVVMRSLIRILCCNLLVENATGIRKINWKGLRGIRCQEYFSATEAHALITLGTWDQITPVNFLRLSGTSSTCSLLPNRPRETIGYNIRPFYIRLFQRNVVLDIRPRSHRFDGLFGSSRNSPRGFPFSMTGIFSPGRRL
jgi:hypothetical protein